MFSGIVETLGVIIASVLDDDCLHFTIKPAICFDDLASGDSVSVNGVCLTVTSFDAETFNVTVVPQTLRITNLADLAVGDQVNLERAMKYSARMGGHYVQGHVDGIGTIAEWREDGDQAMLCKILIPSTMAKYIVNKGFISIDGMSITVVDAAPEWFVVTFIPHTQAVTVVHQYEVGTKVNIEVDMMGKYIEKFLENRV